MSNMSYCRFQNTLDDLRDCAAAIEEMEGDFPSLSRDERAALKALVLLCGDIHEAAGDAAEGVEL